MRERLDPNDSDEDDMEVEGEGQVIDTNRSMIMGQSRNRRSTDFIKGPSPETKLENQGLISQ